MNPDFEQKLLEMCPARMRTIALAGAEDPAALCAVRRAFDMGFARTVLFGDAARIKSVAVDNGINISDFEIIDVHGEAETAAAAVSLIRDGRADILMKGLVHTSDLLHAVLNRETGIRGASGLLSHVAAMYSPSRNRILFLTDVAMVMYPDLEIKVRLIQNAVQFANAAGVSCPRVAPLCPVETLNPAMQSTMDAVALQQKNESGEIDGCIVSGPIALDVAVSQSAANAKAITGPVAGDADILLFHNIDAGNNTIKAMTQFGDWVMGGLIMGARAPVVVNSRSDSDTSKMYSIACACQMKQ